MGNRRRLLRGVMGFVALGFVALVAGCVDPAPSDEETVVLHIEVDVFSGRVNPEFDLEGAEAENFIVMLSDDVPTGVEATPPSVLGFRGFVLTGDSLLGGDATRSIRVVPDGYYVESETGATSFIDDPGPYAALLPLVEDHLGPASLPELPLPEPS